MAKKFPPSVPYEHHLLRDLKDPRVAAGYIEAVLEEAPETLLLALRDVAKAHGIAKVARKAKLARESLYKTLSKDGNPELETITRLLHAMGMRLTVTINDRAA